MRAFLPACVLTASVLAGLLALAATPPERGTVVAIFNPALEKRDLVAAARQAGARLVSGGGVAGTMLLYSDHPGLPERLRRAGAWIVLDPLGAAGCATIAHGRATPFHPNQAG